MATSELKIIINGKDNASGILGKFGNALGGIGKIAGGIVGAKVFMDLARGVKNFAENSFNATADLQAMQVGLESLLAREYINNMGDLAAASGDMNAVLPSMADALKAVQAPAKNMMKELERIAVVSPYQLETVNQTYKMAMAFGFGSDEAKTFTKATLDVAAGVGASNEMLDRMGYNLAQIRLQGKVTGVDIRQLAMAGFDLTGVLKYVGEQMGVNIKDHNDFNKALSEGKITWEDFTRLYAQYADENFGGASERMARTLNGLKSTFADVFQLTMPKILGPALEVITEFTNGVLDKFLAIRESGALEAFGERLGEGVAGFIETAKNAPKIIADFANSLLEIPSVAGLVDAFQNLGSAIQESLPMLKEYGADMWRFLQQGFSQGAPQVLASITGIVNNLAEIWRAHGYEIMSVINFLWRTITTTIMGAVVILTGIIDGWTAWMRGLFDALTAALAGNWQGAMAALVVGAQGAFTAIQSAIETFFGMALSIVGTNMEAFKSTWQSNWDAVKLIVTTVWNNIKLAVTGFVNGAIQQGTDFVNNLKAGIEGSFQAAIDSVLGWVEKLIGEVKEAFAGFRITIPIGFSGGGGAVTGGYRIPTGGGLSASQSASAARYAGLADLGNNAKGGTYTIGGKPGIDQNLVAFWGTRNETVDITPAGKTAKGGNVVNINIYETSNAQETARAVARALKLQGVAL